ncbi:hypothetical protein ACWEOO_02385 [Kribbella sp. NPDC004138]
MATVDHLATVTRDAFAALKDPEHQDPPTMGGAAELVAAQLRGLLKSRRRDVLARYALLADAQQDEALRAALATCFFNPDVAARLLETLGATDPQAAAQDLVALLEGLLFDRIYGLRADRELADLEEVRGPIDGWLHTLAGVA